MGQITSLPRISVNTQEGIPTPGVQRDQTAQVPSTHLAALWVFPRAISTLTVSHPLLALEVNVSGAEAIVSWEQREQCWQKGQKDSLEPGLGPQLCPKPAVRTVQECCSSAQVCPPTQACS